ncbi:DUF3857 domain-containing protein [Antarcticibacterium sp. 1MA-6-2]|uniref:DUF3857 domain-containing protein n=1 Tax=Antarcticibacterium sp. 1MA-6-2 TaxID=2908210 RepID=UPI001F3E71C3|nr:DUF3857 domain-containing protein [Antarcticibacterium sp. 1MA-6-2]UJH92786.1 DUF3857 domain-containing protein [Antarcticibacterium sp. 1MA-6-2]
MFCFRLYILLFLLITLNTFGQHKNISYATPNKWIDETKLDPDATIPGTATSGFYSLLIDIQDNVGTKEYYKRFSYKILNTKGVQDMGNLTIDFDPEYEQIILHEIAIVRDGKEINKMQPASLQVVQREAGMDNYLYDGRLTIIANLTDVRVGDIINYSYTISGSNPVYEGNYQRIFYFQDVFPMNRINFSVTVPNDQNLEYKLLRGAKNPHISTIGNRTKYSWEKEKISAIEYEDNTPAWFDAAPAVEITQYRNWKEVVDKFEKHYRIDKNARTALSKKAYPYLNIENGETGNITQTIKFVQDEIRYLGFENGMNSHKPSYPLEVFNRRYGDCKDKSFLLSELLQAQGITAHPMLVNSSTGRDLENSLPSPNVFDHCIVQIQLENNKLVYIDPTISDQGGEPGNIYFPNYSYGLLLKPGSQGLTKLPSPKPSKTDIVETFILDDVGGGANFTVKTIYRGNESDFQRQEFSESTLKNVQQGYTSFYAELYPGIKVEEVVSFEDDKLKNEFTVFEKYRIDSLWTKDDTDATILYAEFNPLSIRTHLFPTKSTERNMPYYINPDVDITHKTIVFVPEAFNIQNESSTYGTKDFTYSFDVKYKNAKLELTHEYKSLSDHIAPEDLPAYLKEHSRAQENLAYGLSYNTLFNENSQSATTSWWIVFMVLLTMGGTGYFCYRIYNTYDLPSVVAPRKERSIGGWLIIVAIGLAITPFLVLYEINSSQYFNGEMWQTLFSIEENFNLGLLLIGELIYNSAYLIFSLFVALIFFRRRTIAPRIIIIFYAVTFIMTALDTFAISQLSPLAYTGVEEQEMFTDLVKEGIRCLIWIPYFIYSIRVEETFTRTIKEEKIIAPQEQAPILTQ